ncbi:APC family permease [Actinomyces sp. zg-332]|uniref:APC family permease n=1 Tax=Actinomyces sp. zg-332 TaxID=2708340 RepID=UPI00141DD296|nr:APC family permease [Actinomyces sp. zg-332]QPK94658.1 APC family permease [Actinomyces sp. zg-332]
MDDLFEKVKLLVVGKPMRSHYKNTHTLSKRIAIPIFGAVMISTLAYAPDEIFIVLSSNNIASISLTMLIGIMITLTMVATALSYRKTLYEYPKDNSDYEVVSSNLHPTISRVVVATLLVSYVLTLTVSISASASYISLLFPSFDGREKYIGIILILLLALINLRGIHITHKVFSFPVYLFLILVFIMIIVGYFQFFTSNLPILQTIQYDASYTNINNTSEISLFNFYVSVAAFAAGCVLLAGMTTVSNSVYVMKQPSSKNASKTMFALISIVSVAMLNIIFLASEIGVKRFATTSKQLLFHSAEIREVKVSPIIGQLSTSIFSNTSLIFTFIVFITSIVLIIAGNVAFHDFPNLASLLSRDSLLPNWLYKRGDRLTYSNGIIVLSILAIFLMVTFDADVSSLVQLYIITIFVTLSASQIAMVHYWNKQLRLETQSVIRRKNKISRVFNLVGAFISSFVLIMIIATRSLVATLVVIAMILIIFSFMGAVKSHYERISKQLAVKDYNDARILPSRVHAMILVSKLHQPSMRAISYARATNPSSLEILTVCVDQEEADQLHNQWQQSDLKVPLTFVHSPYRDITGPIIKYVRSVRKRSPRDLVMIFIPEYLLPNWWAKLLHNRTAIRLKTRLLFTPGVVLVNVPWRIDNVEDKEVSAKARVKAPEVVIRQDKQDNK